MASIVSTLILLAGGAGVVYAIMVTQDFVGVILVLFFTGVFLDFVSTNWLRHRGEYPKKGEVTIEHVIQFVQQGKTLLALKAYKELHSCGVIAAEKAIQEMKNELDTINVET